MSKTECKRCHGEGMGQHSRANGMCYLCGRMPAGQAVTKVEAPMCSKRERRILDIKAILGNATREHAAGDLSGWLSESCGYGDPTTLETIRGLVRTAPEDVAIRARAAFSRLGIEA